jgi:type VI secretion system protein ImpC
VRALLHLAEFQALEALWRGVRLLTQGVESDAEVRLYLFDVTKADLADDQRENRDARSSRIYRLLAVPAGAPESGWGALGGLYSFGPDAADLTLLGYLGTVAGLVGAPWISAADPRLAGCDGIHTTPDAPDWAADIPPEWQAVRRLPVARWIGLAMPRFLLRLPYGKRGSRCEFLPFEELSESPLHDEYLWGNPALACLLLLIQSVAESGRPLHPGMNLEIGGLRAESLLSERALERILDHGLMPLVSIRDTDRIRLVRFQSVADPTAALGGPWGRG